MRLVDTLCLAVGAGLGSMVRYAVALRAPSREDLPRGAVATTAVNVTASLLIGMMLHWFVAGGLAQPLYALVGMGFAGSLGTQVVKVFDVVAARTGLRDHEAAAAGVEVTDEAMAMERQGQRPLLVEGSEDNFKVTTPADLDRFEFVLSRRAG